MGWNLIIISTIIFSFYLNCLLSLAIWLQTFRDKSKRHLEFRWNGDIYYIIAYDDPVIETMDKSRTHPGGVLFLVGLAGVSAFAGFGYTISTARKVDPVAFSEGLQLISSNSSNSVRPESGLRLALRAFGRASLLTMTGIGGLSAIVWICTGANGWKDFNRCISNLFPTSWKLKPRNPDTNFKTFDELYAYITSTEKPFESAKTK